MNKDKLTYFIKQKANELGFFSCGISKVEFLEEDAPNLEKWLNENRHGEMKYMENHFDKRLNPALLVDGAKSVISLLLNYFPESNQNEDAPKISKYAYGKDYHHVIKDKLSVLCEELNERIGEFNFRVFVDSAPVLDKAWAKKSGLGWIGKNGNLITKDQGSFFFVAEIISELDLLADGPIKDYCGTCTKCIDSCPTEAIYEPYKVDGSKCISYLTIELKDQIPEEFTSKMEDWMFGCDICQDVCPWNRFSKPHNVLDFNPKPKLMEMDRKDWNELTVEVYREVFQKSAVKRTKFEGLKRNLNFLK
ncbi:tRNA epoxyqueuosine(34) reductase QueG [Flavobacteriales bacterium]|nr:tRNA epoxyqueuosine(34) reductase QueG [Flavobacteriales bacterium]